MSKLAAAIRAPVYYCAMNGFRCAVCDCSLPTEGKKRYGTKCAKCYLREYAQRPERKAKEAERRAANRERLAAKSREYHKTHRDAVLVKNKIRYEANRDEILAKQKKYIEEHKEEIRERNKAYRTANAEKIKAKKREQWQANKEQISADRKTKYHENREAMRARANEYNSKNREKARVYRIKNQDKLRARQQAWYLANPHKGTEYVNRRRALKENAEGAHTAEDRAAIFARDGGVCRVCGSARRLALDHIVPLARGGGNGPENLQTLCRSCNSSKGAKTQEEWEAHPLYRFRVVSKLD